MRLQPCRSVFDQAWGASLDLQTIWDTLPQNLFAISLFPCECALLLWQAGRAGGQPDALSALLAGQHPQPFRAPLLLALPPLPESITPPHPQTWASCTT